ncbi:N-acetyltransferase 9 [Coemansia sp. RSA 1722]|nr:N-acetyltransferase 9 [Coemansia sp. RSA 485]KAJ2598595.1 N-acetyltransferase 9 [Coemansia sp. RSA 1722]
MTGSEPLSIEEEYAMQKTWRTDNDKCTFIILSKEAQESAEACDIYDNSKMIGDVNFYLNDHYNPHEAELEVMIAESECSGKGIATEVLKLMMHYAVNHVGVTDFVVRIKETNAASIHIFESKFGFQETERSSAFKEVTLRRGASDELKDELQQWTRSAKRVNYQKQ